MAKNPAAVALGKLGGAKRQAMSKADRLRLARIATAGKIAAAEARKKKVASPPCAP